MVTLESLYFVEIKDEATTINHGKSQSKEIWWLNYTFS